MEVKHLLLKTVPHEIFIVLQIGYGLCGRIKFVSALEV